MVDIDLGQIQASLESVGLSAESTTKVIERLTGAAQNLAGTDFAKLLPQFKGYVSVLTDMGTKTAELRKLNKDLNSSFYDMTDGFGKFIAMTTKFDAFKTMAVTNGTAIKTMGSQFDDLIGRFGGWENLSKRLLGAGFSNIANMTEAGARKFLENASSAQQLENAYINLQAATGMTNQVFDSNNKLVGNLSEQTARYAAGLLNTAQITGETTQSIAQYSTQLYAIPGIMGTILKQTDSVDGQMESLAGSIALAKGAGQEFQTVVSTMQKAYETLSNPQGRVTDNAQKGAEMFALMSEASTKLGLRFGDTEKFLTDVAERFKFIGNNTEAATNILGRFSGALQNTGLTAKASVDVIGHMVDAVKNLDIGTKALFSQRSGGPGGLQGAFQIDNLLRNGKSDEVLKMAERALRQQFNGRIYTQEEAGNSPQAAAQFMRQRSILTSGAFGGLVKDNDSAARLLEAFKSGSGASAAAITAATATKNVTEKGLDRQEKQISVLSQINTGLDRSVALQQIIALNSARELIGTGNAAVLNSYRQSSNASLASQQSAYSGTDIDSVKNQSKKQEALGMADILDTGPAFAEGLNGIKKIGTSVKDNIDKIIDDSIQMYREKKNAGFIANQQAASQQAVRNYQSSIESNPNAGPRALSAPNPQSTVKHQIVQEPLQVNIQVSHDKDTTVQTTTNYPTAKVRNQMVQQVTGVTNTAR